MIKVQVKNTKEGVVQRGREVLVQFSKFHIVINMNVLIKSIHEAKLRGITYILEYRIKLYTAIINKY